MMAVAADTSAVEAQRIRRTRAALKQTLADIKITLPGLDADFSDMENRADPFDGSVTLFCHWRDPHNNLIGSVQVHDSGRIFAEYDVIQNHPTKPGWFIEAVSVWGDDTALRSELRMMPLP
ncbi:MAG: hypothetical protein CMI02_20035 [Oceanospirillaceae bacterium]|nr:hypothetical protein [Oceanospirillaceae bacterium]MBT14319.1 hypothetical protein [Oceanospirillaceae bacterium]|tara:strand:+ start:86305 stop:86667 length:363 start_codon:yes stop_codon:yes gene_type:complete